MTVLRDDQDAFGAALLAHHRGEPSGDLVLERDDGWSAPAMAAAEFFTRPDDWLWWERELLDDVDGPVLDLGCGPGRHAPPEDRRWGTILLMCGNLGLAGGWEQTRTLLTRLHELARPDAVLIADTVDPTLTPGDEHHAYMRDRTEQGLPIGLVRLRLRHGDRVTPWWDLLNVPAADIEPLVQDTGWDLERHIDEGFDQAIRLRRKD